MPLARAKHCKREKSVAVVEYGCGSDNLVRPLAHLDYGAGVLLHDAEVSKHHLDVVPVFRHRAPREPGPKRLVVCDAMHFNREKPALGLVYGDNADALRLNPFKPQKLPISMP